VQPAVPFYPPPIIVAPQNNDSGMPQDFQRRKPNKFPH
jgi:hypothetical protein